jgi:hypothetical protein
MVDQTSDPVLAHLMRRVADRPKLASAAMNIDIDRDALASLPDSAFAWPEKRAFPIHDAGNTLLSRIYREGMAGVPVYVDNAIKQASEIFGVDESMFEHAKVAAAEESDDNFLLPQHRRLRVTEPAHVKVAEEKLRNEGKNLSVVSRALAASRLVEKAAFFGTDVRLDVYKMAGMTVTDTRTLLDWIEARCEAAAPTHKAGYQKLAAAVHAHPSQLADRNVQIKIAETIQELDEMAGLSRHYGRKLPDPMATVFNTEKRANWTMGNGVTLAGRFMPMERLAAYDANFYSDVLGPDIVREASDAGGAIDTSKLATILETLPVDMQRALSAQMR